jgi:hypothetical protein
MHEYNINTNSGAAVGGIPADEANTNDGSGPVSASITPVFLRVHYRDPRKNFEPLVIYDSGIELSEADFAATEVVYCTRDHYTGWIFLFKNAFGKAGWMSEANFEALIEIHESRIPTQGENVRAELAHVTETTVADNEFGVEKMPEIADAETSEAERSAKAEWNERHIADAIDSHVVDPLPVPGGGGPIFPSSEVAQASAPAPEPDSEAVVKLASPVSPGGPYFRDSDRSPFDLKASKASYIYGFDSANNAVVLRNVFSLRKTPYICRPPLASNEAALAGRLHGRGAEELKDRIRGAVKRTGPTTPVEAWTEMLSAFTLFPTLLEELDLDDEALDAIIKLLHNSGFMKSQKADHHGVYFQIADASALEVEVRGQGKLPWVSVGPRDPDELMRLALLVKLLNYKAVRHRGASGANSGANPQPESP